MVSGSSTPPSVSEGVGRCRSEVPIANSMPTKVAPSGTGAVPVALSGPVTAACGRPAHSQKTSPHRAAATEVISPARSLVQVHTTSTHGESDRRVLNRSPMRAVSRLHRRTLDSACAGAAPGPTARPAGDGA